MAANHCPTVPHGIACELLLLLPCVAANLLSHTALHVSYCLHGYYTPAPHDVTCELQLLLPCMAAKPLPHMALHDFD